MKNQLYNSDHNSVYFLQASDIYCRFHGTPPTSFYLENVSTSWTENQSRETPTT